MSFNRYFAETLAWLDLVEAQRQAVWHDTQVIDFATARALHGRQKAQDGQERLSGGLVCRFTPRPPSDRKMGFSRDAASPLGDIPA
ncbi:MAG: hypothetical protein IM650_03405 [Phenylobacterium sp.]|nr:hypothetical protein [Phenylobacterium sp.]MCA6230796.1 hypothetical protein [Phenylobacterium sp.]MCA6257132.1 hypothetical protein [Phenylobacterium sp.]MCA6265044.1 hypothetical protein [Phenylobacterium sp.]MCA6265248.1 hypothetical protein [Phenylobacterium sp.]MCA6274051.1 hypothetical protein [Phenylobacterium sp.]